MNDDQCTLIVEAIKDLTNAVREVGENIDNISCYSDHDLRKELRIIAQVLEDMNDYQS